MQTFFASILYWFLSAPGLFVLAALDSSMVFFVPAAVDITLIFLAAGHREMFWVFPFLATAGSVLGAYSTMLIGRRIGEKSLDSWVPERRIRQVEERIRNKGAVALALPGLLPPPFPLTPFVLVCGALKVSPSKFIMTLAAARFLRFGVEALLAYLYGSQIADTLQSEIVRYVMTGLFVITVIGTAYTLHRAVRNTRHMRTQRAGRRGSS